MWTSTTMSTAMSTSQVRDVLTAQSASRRRDRQSGQGRRSRGARRVGRRTLTARSSLNGHNGFGRPLGRHGSVGPSPMPSGVAPRKVHTEPAAALRTASASVCIDSRLFKQPIRRPRTSPNRDPEAPPWLELTRSRGRFILEKNPEERALSRSSADSPRGVAGRSMAAGKLGSDVLKPIPVVLCDVGSR